MKMKPDRQEMKHLKNVSKTRIKLHKVIEDAQLLIRAISVWHGSHSVIF